MKEKKIIVNMLGNKKKLLKCWSRQGKFYIQYHGLIITEDFYEDQKKFYKDLIKKDRELYKINKENKNEQA